jgi:hypothetical protein
VSQSEETYNHAAVRVHKLLAAQMPSATVNDSTDPVTLSKSVVEAAIKKVADRINWGVENGIAVRFDFYLLCLWAEVSILECNSVAARGERQRDASI